jgi:transcriptional regulator with XRE-family HTH domain
MEQKKIEDAFKYASDNVKLLLKFKGWSQEELCKKTGISSVTLMRRLSKNKGWSLLEAVSIARAFEKPMSEVFFTRMVPNGNEKAS